MIVVMLDDGSGVVVMVMFVVVVVVVVVVVRSHFGSRPFRFKPLATVKSAERQLLLSPRYPLRSNGTGWRKVDGKGWRRMVLWHLQSPHRAVCRICSILEPPWAHQVQPMRQSSQGVRIGWRQGIGRG